MAVLCKCKMQKSKWENSTSLRGISHHESLNANIELQFIKDLGI